MILKTGSAPVAHQRRYRLSAHQRFWILLVGLILALVGVLLVSVCVGAVSIPLPHVITILTYHLLPGHFAGSAIDPTEDDIVWSLRLPRVLLAGVVGAALAVSGTILQALIRNPLADPYIFGVSSGASVGAVAVLTLGPVLVVGFSFQAAAFCGGPDHHAPGVSAGAARRSPGADSFIACGRGPGVHAPSCDQLSRLDL